MPSFGKRVVVLLGMHRSGTSPIARGLKALGVELGEELLPPAPENPTGFWEDAAIQKLNDQLLTSINQVWDSMAPISRSAWSSPEVQTHMLEAVEIVRSRFGKFPLWGFKDPRTARLLPFWQALFGHLDLADSYVLIIRNPISVARSLKTRNNFALEKSYLLWLEHTILAYSETCGRQRVVVDYDALMAEPSAQLRRIAEKLALPLDASMEEAIKDYGDGFLQNSLRHSLFQASDVCLDAHATLLVGKTYDTLRQVALDRLDVDSKDVQSVLASARSGLEAFAPVHSYLERLERQLQDAIEQETLQAARSSKELADLQANLESERKQHLAVTAELESERKKYAEESASERKQHLAVTADLEQVRAQYASVHKQNSHLSLRLRSADRFLQDLRNSPGWMVIVRYRGWVERQRSRHPRLFSRYERAALWWLRKMAGLPRDYPRAEVAEEASPASPPIPEAASAAPGLWAVEHGDEAKQNMRNFFATRLGVFLATDNSLILPRAEQPEVSIVLVLHNQAQLTFGCFSSIAECLGTSALGVEVMVVDNYSTDETNALLQHTRGATVLYNDENVGFLKAVNQAASQAHGRYILLLNNDAQLLPGSLEAAARVLDSSPDVGVVGGRLILPDGTLQEAGSIVWNDGSCLGYGRGDSPTAGPYMFRRNVDYCSGAFLLTRAELFTRLGGFDEAFVPAYYEETDYCMRLWEAGFRVVYEPEAVVLHYEFGSAEKVSGALELQQAHRAVFAARHAERLRGHFAPSPSYVLCARTSGNRYERILMIEDVIPHSWLGAGLPRSARIIRELMGAGALVTFFPMVLQADEWRNIRATVPPEVEVILEYGIGKIERFLEERRGFYGTILVCRPHNMRAFMEVVRRRPDLTEGAALVYDAEAFFAMREILERRLRGEPLEQAKVEAMLAEEASLAGAAQLVLSVSPHECAEFRRLGVDNVEVLGNLLDPAPGQESFAARRGLLFVGRLNEDGSPNVDGLCWFVRDILPLVQKALDHEVHLTVAGANSAPSLSGLNGTSVTMLGQVKDLLPIYNAARVFIAPTRFAAGIPLKVHEAAAHGIPVVATPLLAEQLGWRDGEELLVAGDAPEFAAQCARLYRDETLWTRLRMNAIDRIREDCSPVRFRKTIARIVDATRTHAAPAK